MTACDYKFFSAQAAHTKTLKLQQEKGQSKPSSPAYYNKSLVPACVLALITIVQADENKNNSGHSKINPNLIPPPDGRLRSGLWVTLFSSAETGMSHCGFPGMLRKVPSTFLKERKKIFSISEILETVYTGSYAHWSQCLCRKCLCQLLLSIISRPSDTIPSGRHSEGVEWL